MLELASTKDKVTFVLAGSIIRGAMRIDDGEIHQTHEHAQGNRYGDLPFISDG
jgi:hypothetical protein